jgi:hypothetical protein
MREEEDWEGLKPDITKLQTAAAGTKLDAGKLRYDLLLPEFIAEMVRVLTDGAVRHGDWNWTQVEDAPIRYRAADERHSARVAMGEIVDPEHGTSHEAHKAVNAMFRWYFERHPERVRWNPKTLEMRDLVPEIAPEIRKKSLAEALFTSAPPERLPEA